VIDFFVIDYWQNKIESCSSAVGIILGPYSTTSGSIILLEINTSKPVHPFSDLYANFVVTGLVTFHDQIPGPL
jgi:hypothetical protein